MRVVFSGIELELLADKAAYRADTQTLFLADLHLGKAEHFRLSGVPVPGGITGHDFARINALLARTGAKRLVVLGDFFHSKTGTAESVEALQAWRETIGGVKLEIVLGNHDRHAAGFFGGFAAEIHSEPVEMDGLMLSHEPMEDGDGNGGGHLCGHIHPVARLADFDGAGASLPCFVMTERRLILPAFGRFTGGHRVEMGRLYVCTRSKVVELPGVREARHVG